ncbi:MAG: prolyl oligopeptidase family serine peptidase [Pseudomonadota bacterium]
MTSTTPHIIAHGLWPSPIGADLVAAGSTPLAQLSLGGADGGDVFWLAGRASEGGRNTLLRRRASRTDELTPAPWNVRSRVHEYGGGAYLVDGDSVYFSHFADNRLYLQRGDAAPQALTAPGGRYADCVIDRGRQRLIGVREQHRPAGQQLAPGARPDPDNCLCAIGLDGAETVLAAGHDFYAAPRLSPDGARLAWLSWDHPRMPWQGTQLWLADVQADGSLGAPRLVAGGPAESICQPEWSPDGVLHVVSDRSGWWNLYRLGQGALEALCPMEAEFATPHWSFGQSMYGFLSAKEIICTYLQDGTSHLARLQLDTARLEPIAHPYQEIRELRVGCAGAGFVALLAGAPAIALEVARLDLSNGELEVLARSIDTLPAPAYLSVPTSIHYPSTHGRSVQAFYYAPRNADCQGEPDRAPPLIVIGHGGPTSMASNTLKLATQYWTSRGFGVLDVNYGGSSGFGRAYRDTLKGQWGVVDVDDCVAGARHLAASGQADPGRLIIRGASAGGLTTLCALTFHEVFQAGASYYGVSDLKGLDDDSHKFESHYNAYLIGDGPDVAARYQARSPIHHTARLNRPMIFFQGLDDKVVPPQQSQTMVAALKARGVPVAYVELAGEGHGFRQAANIARTLEAELYFYLRVFGLAAPGAAPAVHIDNLPD